MSKQQDCQNDRIPSYEESIAAQPSTSFSAIEKSSPRLSIQQRNRLKRARLVNDLTSIQIEPAVSRHLENGLTRTIAVLLPSDAFPPTVSVLESNITSPTLPSNTTLLRLSDNDYTSSFLHQTPVVQDLAAAVTASLVDPTLLQLTPSTPSTSLPTASLPARPQLQQQSSFRYMLGISDSNKDPTGSTGQWNLGWRSEADPASTSASASMNEVSVTVRLQDVSFRTESEMGLLESKTVKCLWCEVELKA